MNIHRIRQTNACQTSWPSMVGYCIPRTYVFGGYYGLVVVTPRPQTLNLSHDNLKKSLSDCLPILYMYIDIGERIARWAQSDYSCATQGPPE